MFRSLLSQLDYEGVDTVTSVVFTEDFKILDTLQFLYAACLTGQKGLKISHLENIPRCDIPLSIGSEYVNEVSKQLLVENFLVKQGCRKIIPSSVDVLDSLGKAVSLLLCSDIINEKNTLLGYRLSDELSMDLESLGITESVLYDYVRDKTEKLLGTKLPIELLAKLSNLEEFPYLDTIEVFECPKGFVTEKFLEMANLFEYEPYYFSFVDKVSCDKADYLIFKDFYFSGESINYSFFTVGNLQSLEYLLI